MGTAARHETTARYKAQAVSELAAGRTLPASGPANSEDAITSLPIAPTNGNTPGTSRTPPSSEWQLIAARAICQEGGPYAFGIYTGDGSNTLGSWCSTAEEAVKSGKPYFGRARPWAWVIDVDGPQRPAYEALKGQLDTLDPDDVIVGWSGQEDRRHVIVFDPGAKLRQGIIADVERRYPKHEGIDWRNGAQGGSIRPLFAPHRSGGWSWPCDGNPEDALRKLANWHFQMTGELLTAGMRMPLPGWTVHLATGNWAAAQRLSKWACRHDDGSIDQSGVECQIAAGFRLAGRSVSDYLAWRLPGGKYPSPKVAGRADAEQYLTTQVWDWTAKGWKEPTSQARRGVEFLPQIAQMVAADATLKRGERRVLLGFIAMMTAAGVKGLTTISRAYREIAEAADLTLGTAHKHCQSAAVGRYVERLPGLHKWDKGTFRLRIETLEILNAEQNSKRGETVLPNCSVVEKTELPDQLHIIFLEHPSALRATGWETLNGYSSLEGRTRSTGFKHSARVSVGTFYGRTADLLAIGALVPESEGSKRYRLVPGFDWDAVARQRDLAHVRADRLERAQKDRENNYDRREERLKGSVLDGSISKSDFDKQLVLLREAKRNTTELFERKLNALALGFTPSNSAGAITPKASAVVECHARELPEGQKPSLSTTADGEALRAAHRYSQSDVEAGVRLDKGAPLPRCAACCRWTEQTDETSGLPWHEWCDMPAWLARDFRQRGYAIADHRVTSRVILDPRDLDEPETFATNNAARNYELAMAA